MWRKFALPEVLLACGTVQALAPYILWYIYGPNENYQYTISYLPVLIWGVGLTAFCCGAWCMRRYSGQRQAGAAKLEFDRGRLKVALYTLLLFIGVQLIFVIKLYGSIPMLAYLSQTSDVTMVNDAQLGSAFGQLGLFTVTLFVINGILFILGIDIVRHKRGFLVRAIFCLGLLLEVLLSSMSGKRQGFMITLFFMFIGSCVTFGDGFRLMEILPFQRIKLVRRSTIALCIIGVIAYMGILGDIRIGASSGGWSEWIANLRAYLEYGLINLEGIVAEVGTGPYKFTIYPFVTGLVPYRFAALLMKSPDFVPPFLLEPTAGPGFFGGLVWYTGIVGVIVFSFCAGIFSQFCYSKARESMFFLFLYCQLAWTLFAAHSYNFFFSLVFLWGPAICYYPIQRWVGGSYQTRIRAKRPTARLIRGRAVPHSLQ
jgi:oligosaccharide repeat unit polymerase